MSLSTISAETVNVEPLTAIQLAALRKCDDLVFRHKMGRSTIEAVKRAKPTPTQPFHQEVVVAIKVRDTLVDYGDGEHHLTDHRFEGFEYLGAVSFHPEMQTILRLLHAGDTLTLEWQHLVQSSPALLEAGIFTDSLALRVQRHNHKPGDPHMTFHVSTHNTVGEHRIGRMIRRPSA